MNCNNNKPPPGNRPPENKPPPAAQKPESPYPQGLNIGPQPLKKKAAAQMGKLAEEVIPCGDELASAVNNTTLPLEDWMSFVYDTPDIQLEREMQWPVDRDLIY